MKKRLRLILSETLSKSEFSNVYNSYDIIGDVAIIRVREATGSCARKIAEAIMSVHKNVKTVLSQTSAVRGDFRLRKLDYVAGTRKTVTVHRESGCLFSVDVNECYFSPRLLHERMRISYQVENGETVVNMFAGVGCFSVLIAKNLESGKVYSIDFNPKAVEYMIENIRINKVYSKVIPMLGDAEEIIEKDLRDVADRVLMPLPDKALEYVPYALLALKKKTGWIHYYDFEHAGNGEDPVEKVKQKVCAKLQSLGARFEIPFGRVVRSTGPNWYQVALDIRASSNS